MKRLKKIIIFIFIVILVFFGTEKTARWLYPVRYMDQIAEYSKAFGVDPYLIMSIIKAESNFDNEAVSHKNATGLMQITEGTAEWIAGRLGIEDFNFDFIADPALNIKMGCYYISYLTDMYGGRTECVLAAYNAGFNNVDKWLADAEYSKDGQLLDRIPFYETERYVDKVKNNYKIYKVLYRHRL